MELMLKPARTLQTPTLTCVLKPLALAAAVLALSGCSTIAPKPLSTADLLAGTQADQRAMRKDVQAITSPLTLDEALARALKYNLERRTLLME